MFVHQTSLKAKATYPDIYCHFHIFLNQRCSFSLGSTIKLSFFTTGLLTLILCVLSVAATTVSISVRYRSLLNHVLVIYTFGELSVFCLVFHETSYLVLKVFGQRVALDSSYGLIDVNIQQLMFQIPYETCELRCPLRKESMVMSSVFVEMVIPMKRGV